MIARRFSKPVRDAKRRCRPYVKQTGARAYTYIILGQEKYEVRVFPGPRPAKITRVES